MACTSTFAEDKSGGCTVGKPHPHYVPIYVPQPKYPRGALTRGKEGYAVIEVTVTTTGAVRDPLERNCF
jgi:protein TonB